MGLAGLMYVTGDTDRPPLRVGFPHFYLHGAAAGATGAMLAHVDRTQTGEGQHVDVSCQEAVARALANAPQSYAIEQSVIIRQGSYRQTGNNTYMRITWPCKDGHVNFQFSGGAGAGRSVNSFVRWMAEEGIRDDYLESLDFTQLGYGTITQEMLSRGPTHRALHAESYQTGTFDGAAPPHTALPGRHATDILSNPLTAARQHYQHVIHPELGTPCHLSWPLCAGSATPLQWRRFPPRLGEHNVEIMSMSWAFLVNSWHQLREVGALLTSTVATPHKQ
jgi:crotonobetainyl-CoA:carnitine CoA-transferase CaiB-like acyl-CoA transferase